MSSTTPSIDTQNQSSLDYLSLVLLAAMWGGSFMFIKVAVGTIPPITVTAGRLLVAAILLYITARMAGQALPRDRETWISVIAVAILGNAMPFTLIGWGEEKIDSGLASILMAIVPMCTLLMAHFFTSDEKLSKRKILGLSVGFSGVVFLIGIENLAELGDEAIRQLAIAAGAICYGMTSVINRKLAGKPRRSTAAAIMVASVVIMLPFSIIIDQPWTLEASQNSLLSILALGVLSTALAQILILRVVKVRGASFLSLNNYMVPLFGLMWGMMFLSEQPQSTALIGLVLILIGVAISRK